MTEIAVPFEPKVRARAREAAEAAVAPRRYPARIARQLALAHALQRRVDAGEFTDYAAMARALGFTRARISQIMDLLLLAPDIQAQILRIEVEPGVQPLAERALRKVLRSPVWEEQRREWASIAGSAGLVTPLEAAPHPRVAVGGR